jgi:hypothetical protein
MKKLFYLAILIFSTTPVALAGDAIYVDGTLVSDCTSGNYSIASRNCSGADGNGYDTISEAMAALSSGDDIYIRGGTYNENGLYFDNSQDGTPSDYSSIQSYEGEWAIINGSGSRVFGEEVNICADSNTKQINYFRFERLEITNGGDRGMEMSGGNLILRYLYIHDNIDTGSCLNNPSGISLTMPHDVVVEYNLFENNGCSGDSYEQHTAHLQFFSDYANNNMGSVGCGKCDGNVDMSWSVGWCYKVGTYHVNEDTEGTRNNIVRYNYFLDDSNLCGGGLCASKAFHNKAVQVLTPHGPGSATSGSGAENNTVGDLFHHNISIGQEALGNFQQDFSQIYNNIADSGFANRDGRLPPLDWQTVLQ